MASPWSFISGALPGAATGMAIGGVPGAVLGGLGMGIAGKLSQDEQAQERKNAMLLEAEKTRLSPWLKPGAIEQRYMPKENPWAKLMSGVGSAGEIFSNIKRAGAEEEDRDLVRRILAKKGGLNLDDLDGLDDLEA